mgnify:CR=1 FL=1
MKEILTSVIVSILLYPTILSADHSLSQIERRCEVYKYSDYGDLECSSGVGDRRNLERKCEVYFSGKNGEFDCRGSHYRDVERKCAAYLYSSNYADIDC